MKFSNATGTVQVILSIDAATLKTIGKQISATDEAKEKVGRDVVEMIEEKTREFERGASCQTCVYFMPGIYAFPHGGCRRNPPVFIEAVYRHARAKLVDDHGTTYPTGWGFPVTARSSWCGEFRRVADDELQARKSADKV